MVDVLQTFDDWFSHSGCITAVVESGVLLKALRALRYVCMYLCEGVLWRHLIGRALSHVLECNILYVLCSF